MKRFFVALLAAILIALPVSAFASGCGDANKIKLCEVTHSVFYAPFYVALNNGYFAEEGLTVELENAGGTDKVTAALVSGSAQIGLMGPEGVIYSDSLIDNLKVFGQLTKRDGSFLVSKKDEAKTFQWSNLKGKRVLAGRTGGVPAMTMQYVMNKHGLYHGVDGTNIDTTVAFNMMASVFDTDASVDYTTLFEPTATEYQNLGKGYIVASIGKESGEVPYTAFCAKTSYLKDHGEQAEKFLRAVRKGYEFVKNNDSLTVGKALTSSFTGMSAESLAIAVDAYMENDTWCETPVMREDALKNLTAIMKNAGELDEEPVFADIVDNTIAEKIAKQA